VQQRQVCIGIIDHVNVDLPVREVFMNPHGLFLSRTGDYDGLAVRRRLARIVEDMLNALLDRVNWLHEAFSFVEDSFLDRGRGKTDERFDEEKYTQYSEQSCEEEHRMSEYGVVKP